MRLSILSLLLVLPFLAACDSSTPKAPAGGTATTAPAKPAATKPAATVPASFPIGARPMLGTWAADLANCGDAAKLLTVSATTYAVAGKSCDLAVTDSKDGSFAATCGKQKMTLTPIFGPSGEGIRIVQGDAKPVNVFRCGK